MAEDVLPWNTPEVKQQYYTEPFSVGELLVSSLEAFLTAASLHLGEPMADGRILENPNPMEAWMALMGATGLLVELAPILTEEFRAPYDVLMAGLLEKFATLHPDLGVPTPEGGSGALRQILHRDADREAALDLAAAAGPLPTRSATSPLARPASGPLVKPPAARTP